MISNKKCSNIIKLIMLTLLVSIALSFSVSLAVPDDSLQTGGQTSSTGAVGAGGVPGSMELDVRSDSIWRTNQDNPQYAPVYCMFHRRSLTYFNRPGGGGSRASVSNSASSGAVGTQSTAPTMSVANTLNNFLNMVKKLPDNDAVKRDVTVTPGENDDSVIISGETYLDLEDEPTNENTQRTTTALTWSEYLLKYALSNAEIEPSCGYAIYYLINVAGINPTQVFRMDFQYVIWSSRNFGNDSNMLDPGSATHPSGPSMGNDVQSRADQFGRVYYEILQYDKANPNTMFTITPNDPDTPDDTLKVMIDKTTGLYTVGPYNIKCNYGSTQAKQILYNEITGRGNKGFVAKVRFAEYLEIINLNYIGDVPDVEYLRKDGTKFVEGEGTTNFPDFVTEEDFYIRFKPTEDGAINRLSEKLDDLNPVIRVEYISQIDTDVRAKYESTELQAHEVHGIFQGGQPLNDSMVDWFRALTDKSSLPPTECNYKADKVSPTEPTGWTKPSCYDKAVYRTYGVTDITFTFTFTGTGGSHTVQVTYYGINVYQDLYGTRHCHTPCNCYQTPHACHYYDYTNFNDPDPGKWILVGQDQTASDIIVDGVLTQSIAKLVVNRDVELHKNVTEVKVGGKRINMQLGGYVWLDAGDAKTANFDNLRDTRSQQEYNNGASDAYFKDFSYRGFWDTPNNDKNFTGILVELYDTQKDPTKPIAYTTTDKFGRYRFYGLAEDPGANMVRSILNPLHDYFVKFKFNGQLYTQVESNNDGKYAKWTGGSEGKNSSADEITGQGGESAEDTPFSRKTINDRFETIKSLYDGGTPSAGTDNNSYEGTEGKNKAFAMYQKIETGYGEFSDQARLDGEEPKYVHGYGSYLESWAYAYGDAWDDFIYKATNTTNFENPDYMDCTRVWFDGDYKASDDVYVRKMEEVKGKWGYDAEYVKKFINDCLMKAKTISPTYTIPGDYDKFVINNVNEQLVEVAPLYDPELADTYWATFKNLYTQQSDQSRYVNYGMHERQRADLAIQKDVFNAKVIVDGELETYDYRSKNMEAQASDEAYDPAKDETTWNIYRRREDILYKLHQENGTDRKSGETAFVHPLEIRRSDYLKTWTETGDLDKNLKILITYRIAVKNQGSVPVVINDLIDYYDSDEMEFDGILNGDTYTPTTYKKYSEDGTGSVTEQYINTYISSQMNGSNEGNLTVKTTGYDGRAARTLAGQQIDSGLSNEYKYYYDTLFLSGLNGGAALEPGKITFAYVSFRVKNPEVTRFKYSKIKDKPILDITFDDESNLVGKRNIIEVNSYSTPQKDGDTINYGFVDIDSCAGSLDDNDLNQETGNIKVNNNPLEDHQEDDTDEAPNLRIRISTNDDTRVYTGYAYEDNRNEIKNKAVVGDGEYTDDETRIDGITMQMYQLQRDVDSEGIFTGKYKASAKRLQQYRFTAQDESRVGLIETITDPRYATGTGEADILFDSDIPALKIGELPINKADLAKGTGGYAFASIPSGDYFIRFIYGDTYETVLTSDETDIGKEVKDLIGPMTYTQSQEGVVLKPSNATDNTASTGTATIEAKGLNIKSYNGQDYKSTVYQGLDTGKAIDQSTIYYNGIHGYGYGAGNVEQSYDTQNYSYVANGDYNNLDYATYQDYVKLNDDGNKRELMHYYDIQKGDAGAAGLSDAKDVYYYRWKANNYGRGTQFDTNPQKTQRNTLMEILDSWEKLQTYQEGNVKERQENMLKELMEQTQMVSQTGIISTRGEYNTTTTNGQGYESGVNNIDKDTHEHGYVLKNLNLGLVERPEAQLKLTKKITNFQVTLANGRVLFDASKSVRNLYMAEHKGHMTFFANKDIRTDKQSDIDYKYPYWSDMTNNKTPVDPSNPDGVTQGQEALRKEKENLYNKLGNEQELRRLAAVVTSANSKETPELLQVYMDDELMEGAMMRVRYDFLVENAGEVDYLDKQFYYTGRTAHANDENYVSRTNAYTVVDYVTNMIRYDQQYQDQKNGNPIVWSAKNLNDLINSSTVDTSGNVSIGNNGTGLDDGNGNITANDPTSFRRDLVNRKYAPIVKTYNQILTTDSLRDNTIETSLLPIKYFTNKGEAETEGRGVHRTTLILSTELSTNNTGDNLVYNNLTELVETQNSVGRRMQYSIIGNQSMSDQSLRNDTSITEDSSEDLITPKEIDADSAQKIVITKPTGEFRDYTPWIITAISALAIIVVGAVIIVKKVLGNKTE